MLPVRRGCPVTRGLGIGGHHAPVAATDEWLTPPEILAALGPYDLDPAAAPEPRPWPTAARHYTVADDGLSQQWEGRVWLNPPYGRALARWLARMAEHDWGTALIFARTETDAFFRYAWERASGMLFLRGRLTFRQPDGRPGAGNGGAPSVLIAYGPADLDRLAAAGLDGALVPLRWRIFHPGADAALGTWREALAGFFDGLAPDAVVGLAELYAAFRGHPKAAGRDHWRAKLRQQLQLGDYEALGGGRWRRPPDVSRGTKEASDG